jgi:hypothetical protein
VEGNFSTRNKLVKVQDHTAAGTTPVTSDIIDTQGYEGAFFFTSFGTAAANNNLKAQQGAASDLSDAADLEGSAVASGTSDEDVWIEVYRPRERYLRVVGTRGTSSTLESIWCILYNPRVLPVSNILSGTIVGEKNVSPAEGTA